MSKTTTGAERLAVDGGTPVRTKPFPKWPVAGEREEQLLLEVLHSGDWGEITGNKVATFADKFAAFQGAQYGTCVPNGTMALEMALRALGVGPGDEVITTPYTFIATASAALGLGAKPVFVDIRPDTCNLDPARIGAAVTKRTKAIVPVHIGGQPADLDGARDVARQYGLRVLEDACQAWGAEWRGQRVGAIGDLGTFSFQASKNITAGEGGIVVTNDEELHNLCWSLHNVGRVRDGAWYQHEILGWNFRMPEWSAAILLAQLERLPEQMAVRDAAASYLDEALADIDGVAPLAVDPRVTRHAHHLYPVRYHAAKFGGHSRADFLAALRAEGITCAGAGYVPLTKSPAIHRSLHDLFGADAVAAITDCPVADQAAEEVVWFTQNALLDDQDGLDTIIAAIAKIQRAWG
ncbi:MAG TPA: DegT/DnrJ/EryC1/StrS family aminotransferase [Thermomicrobiales bacterium]|nr:DegT/DnrJ/EryC1/StrS family aminotransferase [Thermomicrobiales bacterium]